MQTLLRCLQCNSHLSKLLSLQVGVGLFGLRLVRFGFCLFYIIYDCLLGLLRFIVLQTVCTDNLE